MAVPTPRYDEAVTVIGPADSHGSNLGDALFDAAPDGVIVVDAQGRIVRANPQAAQLFDTTVEELEGLSVEELMPESLRSEHHRQREEFASNPRTRPMGAAFDLVARRRDGSTFPADIALSPFEIEGEPCVVAAIRNIRERKVRERELRVARERLAIHEDRERIARDLHDTVIQELFASGLGLQAIQAKLDDPELVNRMETAIERLDGSMTRLRGIIFDLRRPTTGGHLSTAIRDVIWAATDLLGFEPNVTIEGDVGLVPPRVEEHLIPTLREALTNVAKHANAGSVEVRLDVATDIVLEVLDDGTGLANAQRPGFGFSNMSDRAGRLGGTWVVENYPEGGARMVWTVPADPPGDA